MAVNAEIWTQSKIFDRVRKDLDLEAEVFYRDQLMTDSLNSAITDCEQLVIDEYSDYLLTYQDYDIVAGQTFLEFPEDIYQSRMRWLHFKKQGFQPTITIPNTDAYKIRKISLEEVQELGTQDGYKYRIVNMMDLGPQVQIYPPIRSDDEGESRFRMWYIRHFKRLFEQTDVTDVPVVEYLLSHLRCQIMEKEGNPMIELELANLNDQKLRLQKTLKFLSDDDEDTDLKPNWDSLDTYGEQFGDYYY